MAQVNKLFEKVCRSNSGHRFDEVRSLLYSLGFMEYNNQGSHFMFYLLVKPDVKFVLIYNKREISKSCINKLRGLISTFKLEPNMGRKKLLD